MNTTKVRDGEVSINANASLTEGSDLATLQASEPQGSGRPAGRFQVFLDKLAGNEQRRFFTGSVIVPLLIAALSILVGSQIASNYQDWQDRRTRTRDIIDGIREATSELSSNLEVLAQHGGAVERIGSNLAATDEIRAVDESLSRLEGRTHALAASSSFSSNPKNVETLLAAIDRCKKEIDKYAACLVKSLSPGAPIVEGEQPCTQVFRDGVAESGSCKSLESESFALIL